MAKNPVQFTLHIPEIHVEPVYDLAWQKSRETAVEATILELTWISRKIDGKLLLLRFVRDNGFLGVINCMKSFSENQQVQSSACSVLIHLFRLDPGAEHSLFPHTRDAQAVAVPPDLLRQVERHLVEQGLVQCLIHALITFHNDQCLRNFGMAILLRTQRQSPVPQECVGTAKIVVALLTSYAENGFFVDMTVELLFFRVKSDSSLLKALLDNGILHCLSLICDAHTDDVRVQRACCTLFFILSDLSPAHRSHFQGHVSKLTRAAKDHLDDVPLVVAACGTLWHIANGNEAAQVVACSAGAVSLITRVLLRHVSERTCVDVATGLLFSLARSSDMRVRRRLTAKPMVVEALVAAVYLHHQTDDIVSRITTTVDLIPEFAALLLSDMDG